MNSFAGSGNGLVRREPACLRVAMRADDRQVAHGGVQLACDGSCGWVRGKQAVIVQQHGQGLRGRCAQRAGSFRPVTIMRRARCEGNLRRRAGLHGHWDKSARTTAQSNAGAGEGRPLPGALKAVHPRARQWLGWGPNSESPHESQRSCVKAAEEIGHHSLTAGDVTANVSLTPTSESSQPGFVPTGKWSPAWSSFSAFYVSLQSVPPDVSTVFFEAVPQRNMA